MLILTRKFGQKIMIGGEIEIQIIAIKRNQIQLGIEAPKEINILKEKVFEKINKIPPSKG